MRTRFSKKLSVAMIGVVGLFVIAFLAFVISPLAKNQIPSSFTEARSEASLLATDIVDILQGTADNIGLLQAEEGDSRELDIVLGEIRNSKTARDKAVLLAGALERMALAIPEISPDDARQTAIVAISSEAALINKMIAYSDGLNQLLVLLKNKYINNYTDYAEINDVIDGLNSDSEQINQFNAQFNKLMENFDQYYQDE